MKKLLLFVMAVMISLGLKAQCGISVAVDFTATDCHGTEVHLFDILDQGQYVLIDFFYCSCGPCQQACPKVVEAYSRLGCNMHDVYFMEISSSDSDAACQTWCNTYGVEYPTISAPAGGSSLCNTYGVSYFPTVILIAPDRNIVIRDLWPINNSQTIVDQLAVYGIQEHDCNAVLNPQVEIEIGEVTATTIEATFTPNADCASYYYLLATESEMTMWQQMMGVTLEQLIQQWGVQTIEAETHTWVRQVPNTEFNIYALPFDIDGNMYETNIEPVATLQLGGEGEALVEIVIELQEDYSIKTITSPNSESAEFHIGLITKEYFDEIGQEEAVEFFKNDGYPLYTEEEFIWTDVEPNIYYYAIGIAKNINEEWGEPTIIEFFNSITTVDETNTGIALYPNPANEQVTISLEGMNHVTIFNTLGQMIQEVEVKGNVLNLNTSAYEEGIYIARINNEKAVRFIVKH